MLPLITFLFAALIASADHPPKTRAEMLVITNQGDETVHLVETASGRTLARIPASPTPHEAAVTGDGRWAVVTNYGGRGTPGHALMVIDLDAAAPARSIDLSPHQRPHGIAFLPGDSLLVVTSETSRAILLVGFRDGTVRAAIPTGQNGTHILAVGPGGRKVYTANVGSGTVTEIDLATRAVTRTFDVGPGSEGAALSPDGRRLWAASMGRDSTYVFDTATGARVAALASPGHAYRVAITPDGRRAVIPAPELGLIRVIDTATMRESTIAIPNTPGGAVFSADGKTAYVPLMGEGAIAVVDLDAGTVVRKLPSGPAPDGMALAPASR